MVILLILMDSFKDVGAGAVTLCRSKTPRGGEFVSLGAVLTANSRGLPTLMSLQMALGDALFPSDGSEVSGREMCLGWMVAGRFHPPSNQSSIQALTVRILYSGPSFAWP